MISSYIQNGKVILMGTLLLFNCAFGSSLDDGDTPQTPPNSSRTNLEILKIIDKELHFQILAAQLKTLKVDGDMAPWNDAVAKYFQDTGVKSTSKNLAVLREKILKEGLPLPMEGPVAKKIELTSAMIRESLKATIAGQDDAIETLSLLAHRFLCNKKLLDRNMPQIGKPSHCILTGPTGCGKSETLRQLGKLLNVATLYINARSLTDEGFKGHNFSESVENFCKEHNSPKSAIVICDEVDKLAIKSDGSKDFGLAIQRVLLSYLDGNSISKGKASYDTSNWWFLCTGAFSAIKGVHDEKDARETTAKTHEDIIQYGFEPEFVGRFPVIVPFCGHSLQTMLEVITRDNSPVSLAKKEMKAFYGIDLEFEEKALQRLAEAGMQVKLGVRSLQAVLHEVLKPHYLSFEVVDAPDSCLVTEREVNEVIAKHKTDTKRVDKNPPPFGMYL